MAIGVRDRVLRERKFRSELSKQPRRRLSTTFCATSGDSKEFMSPATMPRQN